MSDTDRIRAAVDELDQRVNTFRLRPELIGSYFVDEWEREAALLRAVADDPNSPHTPAITAAALALADTIRRRVLDEEAST